MTVQSFAQVNALKIGPKKKYGIQLLTGSKTYHSLLELFYNFSQGHYDKIIIHKNILHKNSWKESCVRSDILSSEVNLNSGKEFYSPADLSSLKNRVGNRM